MTSTVQAAFDIDALIHQVEIEQAPRWEGAPLRYHEEFTLPGQLDAAFDRFQFEYGTFGCIPASHMWNRAGGIRLPTATANGHELHLFNANGDCSGKWAPAHLHQHTPGELPGKYMTQAICPACSWHHIGGHEEAVEAWHDHAFPGWRELPVVPLNIHSCGDDKRRIRRLHDWVAEHYPEQWQQPHCPTRSERASYATRAVAGGSPWKGYDLAANR